MPECDSKKLASTFDTFKSQFKLHTSCLAISGTAFHFSTSGPFSCLHEKCAPHIPYDRKNKKIWEKIGPIYMIENISCLVNASFGMHMVRNFKWRIVDSYMALAYATSLSNMAKIFRPQHIFLMMDPYSHEVLERAHLLSKTYIDTTATLYLMTYILENSAG